MKRFGIMYLDTLNGLKCTEIWRATLAEAETVACKRAVENRWLWFRVHELP